MSNAVTAKPGKHARQGPAPLLVSPCHLVTLSPCQSSPPPSGRVSVSPCLRVSVSPRRSPRRRGSALMVALALLMMLAVFAALFLTSSRFDMDASAADLSAVRMDLYAEGLFQYVQNCLVLGLWGFDSIPLNYDDDGGALRMTPRSGALPRRRPGPDAPYDYFGGRVLVDPDQLTNPAMDPTPHLTGDESFYYPNFWLTDPRVRFIEDDMAPPLTFKYRFSHPAFSPMGLPLLTLPSGNEPSLPLYEDANYATNLIRRWRFADMDGDGRADTPWLFYKPLGNGLYLRAAIRVEDTSSRINVNVANRPLHVDGGAAPAAPLPSTFSEIECLLRESLYAGYPWLGRTDMPVSAAASRFPILSNANPMQQNTSEEQVGRFLSETNLLGAFATWAQQAPRLALSAPAAAAYALTLNNSDGVMPVIPGRFGITTNSVPGILADPLNAPAAPRVPLLGDTVHGDPGRLGRTLEMSLSIPLGSTAVPAGVGWNPDAGAGASTARWRTYDPEGLARRMNTPTGVDRPLAVEDTFDLLSIHGMQMQAGGQALDARYYRAGGSLPMTTRLEQLWPFLKGSTQTDGVQWRRLMTGYSYSLNLCPYGEHPYDPAYDPKTADPVQIENLRKLDLNDPAFVIDPAKAEAAFREALAAANRHAYAGDTVVHKFLPGDMDRLTANFLAYRQVSMNALQLAAFLRHKLADPTVTIPQNVAWDPAVWAAHAIPDETTYLNDLFNAKWNSVAQSAFWAEIDVLLAAGISTSTNASGVTILPQVTATNPTLSACRHPFITEVYMNVQFNDTTTIDPVTGQPYRGVIEKVDPNDPTKRNDYAVELYNPWDTAISLTNWTIVVTGSAEDHTVPLSGFIPPGGRLVVTRFQAIVPPGVQSIEAPNNDLVLALQALSPTGGPRIELSYTNGLTAVYDNVPAEWTKEFNGGNASLEWDIVRRDDNGFWCYQRWARQFSPAPAAAAVATLGTYNYWSTATGDPMLWDPWPVDPYNLGTVTEGFGPNNAVPRLNGGLFLSPAELALIPYRIPNQGGAGMTLADAITPYTRANDPSGGMPNVDFVATPPVAPTFPVARYGRLGFSTPTLFNRHCNGLMPAAAANIPHNNADQYSGAMQSLMDFVTVNDFADGLTGPGLKAALRIPGRLNLNTVADWYSLEQVDGLLLNVPASIKTLAGAPTVDGFWRRLFDYRDKADPYQSADSWFMDWDGRRNHGQALLVRDELWCANKDFDKYAFRGFEQLAEVCNIQANEGCEGFWQNPVQGNTYGLQTGNPNAGAAYNPLLPQEYMRKFARNMNILTTRSDTYMVTVRVEIVRPTPGLDYVNDPANTLPALRNIAVLGQREFMYLTDRSYCLQAPQKLPAGVAAWGGAANPNFNGRVNSAFIPPKVWRMTIPRYAAYGG
jgi:hypothetical protein